MYRLKVLKDPSPWVRATGSQATKVSIRTGTTQSHGSPRSPAIHQYRLRLRARRHVVSARIIFATMSYACLIKSRDGSTGKSFWSRSANKIYFSDKVIPNTLSCAMLHCSSA